MTPEAQPIVSTRKEQESFPKLAIFEDERKALVGKKEGRFIRRNREIEWNVFLFLANHPQEKVSSSQIARQARLAGSTHASSYVAHRVVDRIRNVFGMPHLIARSGPTNASSYALDVDKDVRWVKKPAKKETTKPVRLGPKEKALMELLPFSKDAALSSSQLILLLEGIAEPTQKDRVRFFAQAQRLGKKIPGYNREYHRERRGKESYYYAPYVKPKGEFRWSDIIERPEGAHEKESAQAAIKRAVEDLTLVCLAHLANGEIDNLSENPFLIMAKNASSDTLVAFLGGRSEQAGREHVVVSIMDCIRNAAGATHPSRNQIRILVACKEILAKGGNIKTVEAELRSHFHIFEPTFGK